MNKPEKIAIAVGLVAGVVAGLYYATRQPTSAASPPASPPPASNGTGAGTGSKTVTVTDTDNGATIALNVGDTLLVVLPLENGITDYIGGQTGTPLTKGSYSTATGKATQPWIATQSGSTVVHYQGTAGSIDSGSPITFNVVVS
jgi:hypothetical protein